MQWGSHCTQPCKGGVVTATAHFSGRRESSTGCAVVARATTSTSAISWPSGENETTVVTYEPTSAVEFCPGKPKNYDLEWRVSDDDGNSVREHRLRGRIWMDAQDNIFHDLTQIQDSIGQSCAHAPPQPTALTLRNIVL